MYAQRMIVEGNAVRILFPGRAEETHVFVSPEEAQGRKAIVEQAISWDGTPFKNCSDVKGLNGGVDCAMLLVRSYVDSGMLPPFDPRPYPPHWHLHQDRERFLEWIRDKLGGQEKAEPALGDCIVYQFGRCFSHGAIMINSTQIIHAYYKGEMCHVSNMDEQDLMYYAQRFRRPVKYFEVKPL